MSSTVKNLAIFTLVSGVAGVAVCLVITLRSLHAINAAGTPATASHAFPMTLPIMPASRPAPTTGPTVRVAVIGGMVFTGFWNALAERYQQQTGVYVDLIVSGPKNDIVRIFKEGGVDVITMHASDAMINLSVNGHTLDPQPWMRNDLIIVGPPEDPAGIRGMTDAAAALKKIAESKSNFVVHSSLGAQEVLLSILQPADIQLDPAHTTVLFNDQQRSVLMVAAQKHAYTLVGRIPFRIGRLPNNGLELMVQGDERLMRPYLVAVTNPQWIAGTHLGEARRFAAFLRNPQTQQWIAEFGKGTLDDRPMFFPVTLPQAAATRDSNTILQVDGEVTAPLALSRQAWDQLPRTRVQVVDRAGNQQVYSGVAMNVILRKAGVPIGDQRLRGDALSLSLVAQAADGYRALFSLAELDDDYGSRSVIVADSRNGQPLDAKDGPLRVVASQDARPSRWVRNITSLHVVRVTE